MQLLIKLALIFTLTTLPLTHSASLYNTDDDDESNQEIEGEQNYEDDESNLFAKSEKKLFENFLQRKSDEEKSLLLRELKAKNIEDQKRRRVERKRRRRKSKSGKEKTKSRVNRNTRRYVHINIHKRLFNKFKLVDCQVQLRDGLRGSDCEAADDGSLSEDQRQGGGSVAERMWRWSKECEDHCCQILWINLICISQ